MRKVLLRSLFCMMFVVVCMLFVPAAFASPSENNAEAENNTELLASQYTVTLDTSGISGFDSTVYVDGIPVSSTRSGTKVQFTLSTDSAKCAVMYAYKSANGSDPHSNYPTHMYVWFLSCNNGTYSATRMTSFDDILGYAGCAIRLVGKTGIRMVTSIPESSRNALLGSGLQGYSLVEYGTAVGYASEYDSTTAVTLSKCYGSGKAYCRDTNKDNIYSISGGFVQYTNVLTDFTYEQCAQDLLMRPYMKVQDAKGNVVTIYGGSVQRSIGYIAYQNRNSSLLTRGSNARDFVWDIIWNSYDDVSASEKAKDYYGMTPSTSLTAGTYSMATKLDMSKVAFVADSSDASGASVQLYGWRSESEYQRFAFTKNSDGTYGVRVVGSEKALAVSSSGHSADVIQANPNSNSELQKWWIFQKDGYYVLASVGSHSVIDLTNSATTSGANVQSATYRESDNQYWELFNPANAGVRVARSAQLNNIVAGIIAGRDLPACFSYVAATYQWDYRSTYPTWSYWPEDFALDIATTGSSNCYGFASLFYYCAQALGEYDMTVVSGEYNGSDGWHAHGWCEKNGLVYDPDAYNESGLTWYVYGISLGQLPMYRHI